MPLQKLLSEALARFQLRCCLGRTKHAPATAYEFVNDAKGQRQLWTNHRQIRLQASRQGGNRIEVFQIGGKTFGIIGNSAVPRGTIELRNPRRLPQPPNQRVLASTTT